MKRDKKELCRETQLDDVPTVFKDFIGLIDVPTVFKDFIGLIDARRNDDGAGAGAGDGAATAASSGGGGDGYGRWVGRRLLGELLLLLGWFEKQTYYDFTSSSVLLMYEGKPISKPAFPSSTSPTQPGGATMNAGGGKGVKGEEGDDFMFIGVPTPIVRLIDFPHVTYEAGKTNDDVITGLRSLVTIFQQILS